MTRSVRSSSEIGACPRGSTWSRRRRRRRSAHRSGPGWTAVGPIRPGGRCRRWRRRRRPPRTGWHRRSARGTRPKVHGDVGYFAKDIAQAAVEADCDFSLGVTRNNAAWRAAAAIPDDAWRRAKRMKDAQVAVCGYAPAGWPPGTACLVRRVKVHAADISTDPRARRRRTIPKDQLALALDGLVTHVYAYSFIATNLDVSTPANAVAVEAWHRMRTDIEDRIRDAKHGAALRHLPSGSRAANTKI